MAQELPAERLLARLAERDPGAWEGLIDFLGPRVWPMLCQMLPARALAEEVLREAFVRLGESAELIRRDGGSLALWFVAVSRHLAVARLRRAAQLPAAAPAGVDWLAETVAWLPRPEAVLQLDERMGLLKKVVNQLPKSQRKAVELAFLEGCPEAEIATRLGLPLAKATAELRAAMSFLQHRLRAILGIWPANI